MFLSSFCRCRIFSNCFFISDEGDEEIFSDESNLSRASTLDLEPQSSFQSNISDQEIPIVENINDQSDEFETTDFMKIHIPQTMLRKFINKSDANKANIIETLGLLCGTTVENNHNLVSHLIIPEQSGTSTGCETIDVDGAMDFSYVMRKLNLKLLALIHTHSGNMTSFMSSTDLHQLDLVSRSDPAAISFV